jgi:NaMN:DMB phosphoribosyltransferase
VAEDRSSAFKAIAGAIGVETWLAPLDFSRSAYQGLRDYEKGYVKEGAGAGGSVLLAEEAGHSCAEVIAEVEALYKKWMDK